MGSIKIFPNIGCKRYSHNLNYKQFFLNKVLLFICFTLLNFLSFSTLGGNIDVTISHPSTASLNPGSANNVVLKIAVYNTTGQGQTNEVISSMAFTALNTNNADISNAKLYQSGTVNSFTGASQLGATDTDLSNGINFSGLNYAIDKSNNNTYYFWLTFNVSSNAVSCNTIDVTQSASQITLASPGSSTFTIINNAAGSLAVTGTSVAGTVSGTNSICDGSTTTLTLSGHTGNSILWQQFNSGSGTWIAASGTNNQVTYTTPALSNSTYFRAVVQNGNCPEAYTSQYAITVNPIPTVTFSSLSPVCIDASDFALSGGSPSGGTYSGTGVSNGRFNPATAGVGSHQITYTYTSNGCTDFATQNIQVNALPVVSLNSFADVCVDAGSFALSGGSPAGGVYSGPGVSSGNFNPATAGAGTHTITYTYTDPATNCSESTTSTLTVKPLPNITFNNLPDICESAAPITLTSATPAGGTYFGPGVTNGEFDPAVAGQGTHTISYSFTQNGCTSIKTAQISVTPISSVNFPAFSDVCVNGNSFTLSSASPSGGTYSGPGVSGGQFNPATAGIGTHTITYTFSQNGCTVVETQDITVDPLPTVSISALSDICVNEPSFALSNGSPAGGTYSGSGVNSGNFDPAMAGVGNHTITYTYTDPLTGCTDSKSTSIDVLLLPVITLNAVPDVCINAGTVTLSGALPSGGTYSGTGISGNIFDPALAGVGTHTITYTVTSGGCTNEKTQQITVTPVPVVSLSPFTAVCENASTFALSGGSPINGSYSGPGVSNGNFNPVAAGVGTHTITYTYTSNGCTETATNTIEVKPVPTVTLASISDVCVDASSFTLTGGAPAGGLYSGNGVSNGSFNPAAAGVGTHTITYTYTANGCTEDATTTITVKPLPSVSLALFNPVCEDVAAFTLSGGSPAGGTYAGPGVSSGQFNPAVAGVGTHIISYTYTSNGCENTVSRGITVKEVPTVILASISDVCVNTSSFALTGGSPAGGIYSGNGVSNGNFNPATAGVGNHTITYTYTLNGCTNSASTTVNVKSLPSVTLAAFSDVCVDAAAFTLTGGAPAGGIYSGPGVSGGNFNPATAGAGTHTITYSYTANGCTNTASRTLTVKALPVVTLANFSDVCVSASSFTLTGGSPSGGTYSGNGVSNGSFNPATAGVGTHTITYTYTSNGCENTASKNITVKALPVVSLANFSPVCVNTSAFALSGGSPSGGSYSGPGVSSGNFNPAVAGVGTHTITYTYTSNGCSNSASKTIVVNPLTTVNAGTNDEVCQGSPAYQLSGYSPAGGTWSGTGVSSGGLFTPPSPGTYTLTYSYTNANNCTSSDTKTVKVNALPTSVSFSGLNTSYCVSVTSVSLTGSPSGGTFSGPGISGNTFRPSVAGVGTHTVNYTYTNASGCSTTVSKQVTVNQIDQVTVVIYANPFPICAGQHTTFTAKVYLNATVTRGPDRHTMHTVTGGTEVTNPDNYFAFNWYRNENSVANGNTTSSWSQASLSSTDSIWCKAYLKNGTPLTCINMVPLTNNNTLEPSKAKNSIPVYYDVKDDYGYTIAASKNPICQGDAVTFTATPLRAGGYGPTVYEWLKNGTLISSGADNFTTTALNNGDVISLRFDATNESKCGFQYSANTITMNVNPLPTVTTPVTSAVCDGSVASLSVNATGRGISYKWYRVGASSVPINNGGKYAGATTNQLQITTTMADNNTRYFVVVSDTCGFSTTSGNTTVTVNPLLPASVSISESANNICAGTSVTFTATPTNGGSAPSYRWFINNTQVQNGSSNTLTRSNLTNNSQVRVELTSNATCATGSPANSNTITMTVNPLLPVSVSISSPVTTVCSGTSVTFTATPTNGGSSPSYTWYMGSTIVQTGSSNTYTTTLTSSTTVRAVINSSEACATGNPSSSNTISMTVNPLLPVSVNISESANNICAGTSVTFTATPTNGGSSPSYRWFINNTLVQSSSSNTLTRSNLADNSQVRVELTSNATCATGNPANSNTITMNVNPLLPVSVSMSASATTICDGTSVTFTATPTNGGAAPIYRWFINNTQVQSGSSNTLTRSNLADNDQVRVELTSNATCATGNPANSNTVTMTVNPLLPVNVSISESANNICAGTSVTFTATPTNGGSAPSYRWFINNTQVQNGSSNTLTRSNLTNNSQVRVELTSNATCATGSPSSSNTITMSVNPLLTASVSVTSSANNVCSGTAVTFTATPTNGGTSPSYRWFINNVVQSGASGSTFTSSSLANGDNVTVELTSSASCVTNSPVVSAPVQMSIDPKQTVAVNITTPSTTTCTGNVVEFTANPTNGGSSPMYNWYVNNTLVQSGNNNVYVTNTLQDGDKVKAQLTSSESCVVSSTAMSNEMTMVVSPYQTCTVAIASDQAVITGAAPVTFTANVTNGGANPTYRWILNGTDVGSNTNTFVHSSPMDGDSISCEVTPDFSCTNAVSSQAYKITFNPLPVDLIYFKAENVENRAELTWATAMEENCKGFEIQIADEELNFETIGFVESKNGNAKFMQTYSFTDPANHSFGTYYYRLKQIDKDGKFEYFGPKVVNFTKAGVVAIAYPNPFSEMFVLEIDNDEERTAEISIMDITGRIIYEKELVLNAGNQKMEIRLPEHFSTGLYTVIINTGTEIKYIKMTHK